MSFRFMQTQVEIALAEGPWPEADALLLPTNDYLWMATGPALTIKQSAGEEVELEAVRSGPIPVGGVVATGSGNLPLSGIVHAAVMGQDLHVDGKIAGGALRRGIAKAIERRWQRLLIHSFLGTGRSTSREVAHQILDVLVDELLEGLNLQEIVLLALDESERAVLHQTLLHIVQSHD